MVSSTKQWVRKNSIVGIYKITSPSSRVYIGQSWDIKNRWRLHRYEKCTNGPPILKRSFLKYGISAHRFEVIHELPHDVQQEVLDRYEILYIDLYKAAGFKMHNLKEGGGNAKASEDTKRKMSERMKQRVMNGGVCFKKGQRAWNKGTIGLVKAWNKGLKGVTKMPPEQGRKISVALKGKVFPKKFGKAMPQKTKEALRKVNVGRKMPKHLNELLNVYRKKNAVITGTKNKGKIRTQENKDRISQTLKLRTDNKGELHNMAKVTEKIVLEIRAKYVPRIYTSRMLAKEYSLSKTNILDIVNRNIWNHI